MIDLAKLRLAGLANGKRLCVVSGDDLVALIEMIERPQIFSDSSLDSEES